MPGWQRRAGEVGYRGMKRILLLLLFLVLPVSAQAEVYSSIVFPVDGVVSFSDTFGAERSGGRTHEGIDILAEKHTPVLAASDGTIGYSPLEEPSYGWYISLIGDDGFEYVYVHLNNDNPGTDDGNGGRDQGIADGIVQGVRVSAGQLIGWVGDSGNAEETAPHLHFEMRDGGAALNPYETLLAALGETSFSPDLEAASATSISVNQLIPEADEETNCDAETLISATDSDAVYYCGRDGKRYIFQNSRTYFTWYEDFDDVIEISPEDMASVPFGGVVTYKPGVRLVKLQSVPKVYAVSRNGVLRWVPDPDVAASLFGSDWASQVDDLSDAFFPAYEVGEPITTAN